MDLGISGKKALVMGASGGLGRAIAEALADEGVEVLLTVLSFVDGSCFARDLLGDF